MKGPVVLAIVDAFGRHDLIVKSEPTENGRLGVTVENREGKVLLLGMGDILADEEHRYFISQGAEVYQWRRASPSSCAQTNYTVKNPGTGPHQRRR